LSAAVDGERRKVRFDPSLTDRQLLELIEDELSGRPSSPELQRLPDDYVCDHVGRLHRFLSNIDYFLDSS